MTMLDAATAELEMARKIFWLLTHDFVFLSSYNEQSQDWDDGSYPAINCNDLFVPGSDAQSLSAQDLDAYIEACKRHGDMAEAAWCAVKRSSDLWRQPKDPEWTAKFEAAKEDIKELLARTPRDGSDDAS